MPDHQVAPPSVIRLNSWSRNFRESSIYRLISSKCSLILLIDLRVAKNERGDAACLPHRPAGRYRDVSPRFTWLNRLRSRFYHRFGGEEILVHRAHVDVPAFALRRVLPRQITHCRKTRLHVIAGRAHDELALEGIDCHLCVGHRTVAIRRPEDVGAPQRSLLVVSVDVRLEPYFGIHVHDGVLVEYVAGLADVTIWSRLDDINVAHLPIFGAR